MKTADADTQTELNRRSGARPYLWAEWIYDNSDHDTIEIWSHSYTKDGDYCFAQYNIAQATCRARLPYLLGPLEFPTVNVQADYGYTDTGLWYGSNQDLYGEHLLGGPLTSQAGVWKDTDPPVPARLTLQRTNTRRCVLRHTPPVIELEGIGVWDRLRNAKIAE